MRWLFAIALMSCGPGSGGGPMRDAGARPDYGASCPAPPLDSDGDGISDEDEGAFEKPPRDTGAKGTPDYLSLDSDSDGIPDAVEGRNGSPCFHPVDSDGDGKPDFEDIDSDAPMNDTIGDHEEAGPDPAHPVDSNLDGRADYWDPDDDGDHLPDRVEMAPNGGMPVRSKAVAPDTNNNGVPDYLDLDSDGDTIDDAFEGAVDTDGNGIPNFRDLDSDGDCIPDAFEGGVTKPGGPPVDTDGDGVPDFESLDSDGEGLADRLEDKNCNGKLDACETDRLKQDTDGDGYSDLVEWEDCAVKSPQVQAQLNCLCDGNDPSNTPATWGDFVFQSDYMKPPSPMQRTLSFRTDVGQADVMLIVDTTLSLQASLNKMASDFAGVVVPSVRAKIPNLAIGVVDFKDFGDPYVEEYDHRIQTVSTAAGVASIQAALQKLATTGASGGGDLPEAQLEALYAVAGGPTVAFTGNNTAWNSQFFLSTVLPTTPTAGETQGTLGNAGWRAGSIPIVVLSTDADWHDKPGTPASGENGLDDYGSGTDCPDVACNAAPSRALTVQYLNALNARVIYVVGQGGGASGNPKAHGAALAVDTGAVVSVGDFGAGAARPSGCATNQCCTGTGGAGESDSPAGSGLCPLSFSFDDTTGSGVSSAVVSGILALAESTRTDVHVAASDVDPGTVDNFVSTLVPNLSGAGDASICVTMTPSPLVDEFTGPKATPGPDGVLDTFPGMTGGQQICFDVIPKMNTTVKNTDKAQLFHAQISVIGVLHGTSVPLGPPRDLFFLLAPVIMHGPIM